MHSSDAVRLLKQRRHRPGTSLDFWAMGPDRVGMEYSFDSYDSSPREYGPMHPAVMISSPPISFSVAGLSEEQVIGCALKAICNVEIHESREFFRDGPGGKAEFHPHNASGERAWQRIVDLPVEVRYPQPDPYK